jgi:hypothetical protein
METYADHERYSTAPFEPAIILPAQFFGRTFQKKRTDNGERKLLAAALEDALNVYYGQLLGRHPTRPTLFRETEEWIASHDCSRVFTFERICEALDLDAARIRRRLRTDRERLGWSPPVPMRRRHVELPEPQAVAR